MKRPGIKPLIEKITRNESMSIDERIDCVFDMCEQIEGPKENDVEYFSCLIDMVKKDNGPHIYDRELLQLCVLLAESYVELKEFQKLKDLAYEVLELLRDDCTCWEAANDTLPRIMDAVGETVYNHVLYELHLMFIRLAHKEGKLDDSLKGRVRKFLKLRLLLPDVNHLDYHLFPVELQNAVADLFSSRELMKILTNPSIGHLKKDPVEYSWEWEQIYYVVEKKLEERFANAPRQMGFCFRFWSAKQELLKEEYGIDWHTPSQMNPHVMFD